jgi:predicted kinase/predicted phosphodiesterase
MNTINVGMHTVVILVGPSQSGKSTWAWHFVEKIKAKNPQLRTTVLSSDEIRREILGKDLDRYHPEMLEASEAAFDLLFSRLASVTRFPINNEFVVVDTTGLDPDFRFKVADLAKQNNYRVCVVLFDYSTNEYFKDVEGLTKTIVSKHVEAFKQRVLLGIKRKSYDYSFSVKSKEQDFFSQLEVNIADLDLWERANFFEPISKPLAIIGDVHESVDALKELVSKLPENSQIVFLGDLFDKGQDTANMLEYLEELVAAGAIVVVGNHESFVARRLLKKIEAISNEGELFSSLKVFQDNPDLAQRFLRLYEKMLPFAVFKNYGKTIYVTHAPCYNSFLGKLSEKAQKFQRNFYFASRESANMISELRFVEDESKNSHPIHVFGHIAHAMKHMEMKNKVWLDSGAVYGRKLSALVVSETGNRKIVSINSTKLVEGKLLVWKKADPETIEIASVVSQSTASEAKTQAEPTSEKTDMDSLVRKYKLESEDIYWLNAFAQSNAKFISGTIAPAKSNEQDLEPIVEALRYFKSKGVEQVILQPKWMGSRLQVYLHKDRAKDFAVTRSGTKAGHAEVMKAVFDKLHDKFDSLIDYQDQVIFDGELLPWSAIGKELIEKDFLQYGKSIEKEIDMLADDPVFAEF